MLAIRDMSEDSLDNWRRLVFNGFPPISFGHFLAARDKRSAERAKRERAIMLDAMVRRQFLQKSGWIACSEERLGFEQRRGFGEHHLGL